MKLCKANVILWEKCETVEDVKGFKKSQKKHYNLAEEVCCDDWFASLVFTANDL